MCDSYVCAGYIYMLYLEALTSSKNELDPASYRYKLLTVSTIVFRAWLYDIVSHQRPLVLKHCRFNFHYCIFKVTRPLYLHVILKHVSSSWHVIFSLYEKLQAGSLEFALNATFVTGL